MVLFLIGFTALGVVAIGVILLGTVPCHQYWKDAHGYPTGPCTRGALHLGQHRRDTQRMSALGKFNCVMRKFGLVLVQTVDDDESVPDSWCVMRWKTYLKRLERCPYDRRLKYL